MKGKNGHGQRIKERRKGKERRKVKEGEGRYEED